MFRVQYTAVSRKVVLQTGKSLLDNVESNYGESGNDHVRVKTCRISLSYTLVESFHFYVQIFGLWPKVVSEKQKQVAVLV